MEAKIKKESNGIYSIRKQGMGLVKGESEVALAKFFIFLIFNFLNYKK